MQPDQVAIERGLKMAAANTWDAIVVELEQHVVEALEKADSALPGRVSAAASAA